MAYTSMSAPHITVTMKPFVLTCQVLLTGYSSGHIIHGVCVVNWSVQIKNLGKWTFKLYTKGLAYRKERNMFVIERNGNTSKQMLNKCKN